MVNAVAVGASDLAMVDIMKISGVTGWMAALPTWHFQSSPQTSSTAIHNSH
jgi:mandelate racemase